MSQKYSGGFITKSPVAPTTSAASGIWTLDQQQQAQKAGTWPSPPIFIEDLFSTYLYTGNSSTQTITNGIDLSTNGGLVWLKDRNAANPHFLTDTLRGTNSQLSSNSTAAAATNTNFVTAFNSNGFTLGSSGDVNNSTNVLVSWTFREQPKFFDVVTYTGTGLATTIPHSLGSVPGCIIVKKTSAAGQWCVYHRGLTSASYAAFLNLTDAETNDSAVWNATNPTSTVFSVGTSAGTNSSGATYVAYLFAHNAGGFPVSGGGSTNGISCGSFTTDGSGNASVTLGYEPQWILFKKSSDTGDWDILDTMRGWTVGGVDANLKPNTSQAESAGFDRLDPTATGFVSAAGVLSPSQTFIYIAIRRGPMKVPTLGTSIYNAISYTGDGTSNRGISVGFTPDLTLGRGARADTSSIYPQDRLRGLNYLITQTTDAESSPGFPYSSFSMDGIVTSNYNNSGAIYGSWAFKRAPSFFDEVCYTGTGPTSQALTHNLTVQPTLIIVKARSIAGQEWAVQVNGDGTKLLKLNSTAAIVTNNAYWNDTNPTATTFTVGPNAGLTNNSGTTYVAYLFATCAGVSKVGTYSGNNTSQPIPCGFTGGARFVLIKRTDSTGDWYVYDTSRGMTVLTDPYLLLNTTAAEVPTLGSVTTTTGGFTVDNAILAGINATGGTYIFLAIA